MPVNPVGWGSYSSAAIYTRYANAYSRASGAEQVVPVTPVPKSDPVSGREASVMPLSQPRAQETGIPFLREGADPVAMAVRSRIQYPDQAQTASAFAPATGSAAADGAAVGAAATGGGTAEMPAAELLELANIAAGASQPGQPAPAAEQAGEEPEQALQLGKTPSAQETMEEAECQTCAERKYQDGSDDPGVSFKSPTSIAPEAAASAVRGHEMEHVVRERAKAEQEDREVVSQSVTLHTAICPECGKAYVSGGTTRTTTRPEDEQQIKALEETEKSEKSGQEKTLAQAIGA